MSDYTLFVPLSKILASAYRGVPGIQLEVAPGAETRGRHGKGLHRNARGQMLHHTGGPVETERPAFDGICSWCLHGSDIAPLAQIVSRNHPTLVRVMVLAEGYCNHGGAGWSPLVGTNGANPLEIGWEAQHSGGPNEPLYPLHRKAILLGQAAIADFMGWSRDALDLHKTYAPDRKVDPIFTDLEGWRRELRAVRFGQTMQTKHYAQAVVGWSATDAEHARIPAAYYELGLLDINERGELVDREGRLATADFAILVGAAAGRDPNTGKLRISRKKFKYGVMTISGVNRDATALAVANFILEHPREGMKRTGRPW